MTVGPDPHQQTKKCPAAAGAKQRCRGGLGRNGGACHYLFTQCWCGNITWKSASIAAEVRARSERRTYSRDFRQDSPATL